jgi:hypothetical protein
VSICEPMNERAASHHRGRIVRSVHVVPAEPGWAMAMPLRDDSNHVTALQDEPVLAWAIEMYEPEDHRDSVVVVDRRPIVADPCCDVDKCLWRRPNGSLFASGICDFIDATDAVAYLQEQVDAAAERLKRQRVGSLGGAQQ